MPELRTRGSAISARPAVLRRIEADHRRSVRTATVRSASEVNRHRIFRPRTKRDLAEKARSVGLGAPAMLAGRDLEAP